jgi:hypothetical protein
MQINEEEEEVSRTETSAVFVLVSGKGRYRTGSTRNNIMQKEPMSAH